MISGRFALAASRSARSEPEAMTSAARSMRTASRCSPFVSAANSTPSVGGLYLTPTFDAIVMLYQVSLQIHMYCTTTTTVVLLLYPVHSTRSTSTCRWRKKFELLKTYCNTSMHTSTVVLVPGSVYK